MPASLLLKSVFLFLTLLMSASCLASAETARLNQWLDTQYEKELLLSPTSLTGMGRKELYDRIDDYSRQAEEDYRDWLSATGVELKSQIDYESLTVDGKVSYDFWMHRIGEVESGFPFRDHDYVMTTWSEAHTAPVTFMINNHAVDSEADMVAYITRINGWARALGQLMDRVEYSAAQGIRPPRFSYYEVIEQSGLVIEGEPFSNTGGDSPLWADAREKIDVLARNGEIDSSGAIELRAQAKKSLMDDLLPAYQRIIRWHEKDIENTAEQAQGVHALPSGEAYYQYRLALNIESDMSFEDVHSLGLSEVARIKAEMNAIMKQVGFQDSLQDFFQFVRSNEQFYFSNNDSGREAYLDETRRYLARMESMLPQYFGRLPLAPFEVKRVEAYREQDGAAAFYREGTADGSRPGVYYLHLSDMKSMNRVDLETTAYHEGSPGHHMQGSIAMENAALPLFRRIEWSNGYGEGWALYSEYLAKEMGAFQDPYMDFGRLVNELWRALRLVVDSGLHGLGWSERQAIDYMLNNSSSPEPTVRSEVHRYLLSAGQASSYKAGMLRILSMRARAEAELGEEFDIREFHDLILEGGSLPLPVLDRRIDVWIANQSK
ncbi:MAG: DUF885 domain-containing protein [Halioglobus sp.]